jgi:predicted ATPase/class 3 adenylate cyclase
MCRAMIHETMASELPTGVVTLLFTDVEGSTRLLREMGDAYAGALAEHRHLIRAAADAHGGVEVDTQGDAFFIAFARASDAVAAAGEAQRALAVGPIRVRMGLHTGEPQLGDEGYVGIDVHRAARIAAAGHGGQVLLSGATRALVDAEVRDLGPHRLKDLTAPERLYQLCIDGLPADFPPPRTLDAGASSLPALATSFVGRSHELAEVDRLLDEQRCRLLTLLGPGGVGKTRLALEAASRRRDRYPHGVHFVSLAAVPAPDLVPSAIAETLQFVIDAAHSGVAGRQQLLDYLAERTTLLVLDNYEHLVDGSGLLGQVIEQAPGVTLLATSRERLGLQGEWVLDLDGLDVAGAGQHIGTSVQLFVERARQADPSFGLTDATHPDVVRICRLVDGLPLGIELAAAWTPMLACREIADEIERNLGFLESTARDVPQRHRSLRAVYDHSWRLLDADRQEAFRRLSTLRGPFTREAAAAVAGADLRILSDLVGKSLVRRREEGRFDIHELLRQYAAEQLAADPDAERETLGRHAAFFLGRLQDRQARLLGPDMAAARDELRGDLPDLRAATVRVAVNGPDDTALRVFHDLWVFFFMYGEHEGSEVLAQVVAAQERAGTTGTRHLGALVHRAGAVAALGYDEQQEAIALECLGQVRDAALEAELAACLLALGTFACVRDDYPAALTYLDEAASVYRALGDQLGYAGTLSWAGFTRLLLDDLEGARANFEAGDRAAEASGNPLIRAYLLSKLGLLADAAGDFGTALQRHARAQELFSSVGDVGGTGYTLGRSSMSAYCLGELGRAGGGPQPRPPRPERGRGAAGRRG